MLAQVSKAFSMIILPTRNRLQKQTTSFVTKGEMISPRQYIKGTSSF